MRRHGSAFLPLKCRLALLTDQDRNHVVFADGARAQMDDEAYRTTGRAGKRSGNLNVGIL
jgi:hypothetical protein